MRMTGAGGGHGEATVDGGVYGESLAEPVVWPWLVNTASRRFVNDNTSVSRDASLRAVGHVSNVTKGLSAKTYLEATSRFWS